MFPSLKISNDGLKKNGSGITNQTCFELQAWTSYKATKKSNGFLLYSLPPVSLHSVGLQMTQVNQILTKCCRLSKGLKLIALQCGKGFAHSLEGLIAGKVNIPWSNFGGGNFCWLLFHPFWNLEFLSNSISKAKESKQQAASQEYIFQYKIQSIVSNTFTNKESVAQEGSLYSHLKNLISLPSTVWGGY